MITYTSEADVDWAGHAEANTPFLLKRALSESACGRVADMVRAAELDETAYGGYPLDRAEGRRIERELPLFQRLRERADVYVQPDTRMWRHRKGNFTRNHYDGNGVHVLNLCLAGSKRFSIARPGAFWTLPLSNIGVAPDPTNFDFEVDLVPGDLLYIPRFWFHKVRTLEDDSVNVNANFYYLKRCGGATPSVYQRNDDVLQLHRFVRSHMWQVDLRNDCFPNTVPASLARTVLLEGGPIFAAAFVVGFFSAWWLVVFAAVFVVVLMFKLSKTFYGTSELYGYVALPALFFGLFWKKSKKKRR